MRSFLDHAYGLTAAPGPAPAPAPFLTVLLNKSGPYLKIAIIITVDRIVTNIKNAM